MYNSQTCPLGALHPPSLPGPGVVHELCVMRTCEGHVARYLFYATTSLLSALILSSYCGKASFSAYSIYLGSSNRNSKFKCWCLGLIQAKQSFWEKQKIGKPLCNGRWLIGADSLPAATMPTSEAPRSCSLLWGMTCYHQGGQKWSQSRIIFWLLFLLGVVWKDKVWFPRVAYVAME